MGKTFDYNFPLNQAVQKIKSIREPHSVSSAQKDSRAEIIRKETAIIFCDQDYDSYINIISGAKITSISCLQYIICALAELYGHQFKSISVDGLSHDTSRIHFAFKDISSNTVLFFKEPENSRFWKINGKELPDIEAFLNKHTASACQYVYLMYDRAYMQIIGHNNDLTDPGRGYNIYSLRWFFEKYFGEEEYSRFRRCFANYISYVKQYLGFSVLRSLAPYAEVNFKRVVKHTLLTTAYERILNIPCEHTVNSETFVRALKKEDFFTIRNQYLKDSLFLTVLGNKEYAESLITAEWLHCSMKEAHAIDLTAVVMGYFKSAEQLLSALMSLLQPNPLSLDSDSSLGAIAHFFKDNLKLFKSEISYPSRKYIRETLFAYGNLRNGYLHKHNIHNWEDVDKIRDATFNLFFLMLGSLELSAENRRALGMPLANIFSDYYQLCEYINYHAGDIFFLCYGDGRERIVVALPDKYQEVVEQNYFKFSGAYYHTFALPHQEGTITENNQPEEIYLVELAFSETDTIQVDCVKKLKIFSNGKFIGPSIIDEKGDNY